MAFHTVGSCGTNWTCAHKSKMGSSWCNTGSCHSSQCLVALALAWSWLTSWPWLFGHGFVGLLGRGWLLGHRLCLAGSSRYTYAHTSKSSLAAAALPRGRGVLFCRHPGFQCAEWVAISLWHWNFKGTNVDMEDSDYMHVYVNKDLDDTILETNYYEFIR